MRTLATALLFLLFAGTQAQEQLIQERHPNGKLASTQYLDGDQVRFITYYESGRVKEMGGFRDGLRDGVWKQFDENGVVLCEALFASGLRNGRWTIRNAQDQTVGLLSYADGDLSRAEQRSAAGDLIAARTY